MSDLGTANCGCGCEGRDRFGGDCGCGGCNGGCGCTKQQPLSQDFTIPIQSASTPTVTIEQGAAMNAVAASACQPCSRTFVSETPITVTVATAATPTA